MSACLIVSSRVLLTVSEKYSTGNRRLKARPDQLVALANKYETDLKIMRELYKRADDVKEVAIMKVTTLTRCWLVYSMLVYSMLVYSSMLLALFFSFLSCVRRFCRCCCCCFRRINGRWWW